MGDIGGAAQAGASIIDTTMNIANQQAMLGEQDRFNAEQAGAQRSWSAQQANLNRQFQAGQQVQAEDYNTQMSDTAMQRRVTDLKAAGINPLLAAGNLGGASAPVMGSPSGSMPSGASASAANPSMSDISPMTRMQELKLASAQTASTQQDATNKGITAGILQDQRTMWDADTTPELMTQRTQTLMKQYQLDYGKASEVDAAVNIIRQASQQADLDTVYDKIRNRMDGMSADVLAATKSTLIMMDNATNTQQAQEAHNVTNVQKTALGQAIAYAQAIGTGIAPGAQAAHSASGAASMLSKIPW